MEYRRLGPTGLMVSSIGLGTVYFGSQVPEAESIRIIRRALDRGINFIDTAEIYMRPAYGAAEEVVGRALEGRRHDVVLATKKRYDPRPFRTGGPSDHGSSYVQIIRAVEGSLRRLRTDYIDLYYAHQPDPEVPLEETLGAFHDLIQAEKVCSAALSNHPASRITEALWIAARRGFTPIAGVQVLYNLLDRGIEEELIPAIEHFGLGLVTYSPLAGGVLTGKYGADAARIPPESRAARVASRLVGRPGHIPILSERNLGRAIRLTELAAGRGETAARLAIAWVLHQPHVTATIMGASTVAQLDTNLSAAEIHLSADDRAAIAAAASG